VLPQQPHRARFAMRAAARRSPHSRWRLPAPPCSRLSWTAWRSRRSCTPTKAPRWSCATTPSLPSPRSLVRPASPAALRFSRYWRSAQPPGCWRGGASWTPRSWSLRSPERRRSTQCLRARSSARGHRSPIRLRRRPASPSPADLRWRRWPCSPRCPSSSHEDAPRGSVWPASGWPRCWWGRSASAGSTSAFTSPQTWLRDGARASRGRR
jgi:hypothetical protein